MRLWGVEDLDFGLKAWLLGYAILHDPVPKVGHRFRRAFDAEGMPMEQMLANQLRMARKHFTDGVWADWVNRCRHRHPGGLTDPHQSPEGLWAKAWLRFEQDRPSAEFERAYLLGRRTRDEFWYAQRFGLRWPRLQSDAELPPAYPEPQFQTLLTSPSPPPDRPEVPPTVPCGADGGGGSNGGAGGGGVGGAGSGSMEGPNLCTFPSANCRCGGGGAGGGPGGGAGGGAGEDPCCPPEEDCCECSDECSDKPIRFVNGEVQISVTDLIGAGFGAPWRHRRTYSNQLSTSADLGNGVNWVVESWPYLIEKPDGSIVMVRGLYSSLWFDLVDGDYVARYGAATTLEHDVANDRFVLTQPGGRQWTFHDFDQTTSPQGLFASMTTPGGEVTEVSSYVGDQRIEEIQRSWTSGGDTTTESFRYTFDAQDRCTTALLRRQVNGGSWEAVRRALYEYYASTDTFGGESDLKRVRIQVPDGGSWENTAVHYYRYYKAEDSDGFAHGLKFAVGPEAYELMLADSIDPLTATNTQVAQYADFYFEYDSERRATLERVDGGSRTFTFAFTTSSNADAPNNWAVKTSESRPDGNQRTVFTNFLGQRLVDDLADGSDHWIEARQYGAENRLVEQTLPSAVIGYNEAQADLGVSLRASDGLIQLTDYYSSTGSGGVAGYRHRDRIKQGSGGTPVTLRELQYATRSAGGQTVHPVSKETRYREDDGSGTVQVQQRTTTLPSVPASQNGSGDAGTTSIPTATSLGKWTREGSSSRSPETSSPGRSSVRSTTSTPALSPASLPAGPRPPGADRTSSPITSTTPSEGSPKCSVRPTRSTSGATRRASAARRGPSTRTPPTRSGPPAATTTSRRKPIR